MYLIIALALVGQNDVVQERNEIGLMKDGKKSGIWVRLHTNKKDGSYFSTTVDYNSGIKIDWKEGKKLLEDMKKLRTEDSPLKDLIDDVIKKNPELAKERPKIGPLPHGLKWKYKDVLPDVISEQKNGKPHGIYWDIRSPLALYQKSSWAEFKDGKLIGNEIVGRPIGHEKLWEHAAKHRREALRILRLHKSTRASVSSKPQGLRIVGAAGSKVLLVGPKLKKLVGEGDVYGDYVVESVGAGGRSVTLKQVGSGKKIVVER